MSIRFEVDGSTYLFYKKSEQVFLNGEPLKTDLDQLDGDKQDSIEIYQLMVEGGLKPRYARVKASLLYASYVKKECMPIIEIFDAAVLILSQGLPVPNLKLFNKITIQKEQGIMTINDKKITSIPFHEEETGMDWERLLVDYLNSSV